MTFNNIHCLRVFYHFMSKKTTDLNSLNIKKHPVQSWALKYWTPWKTFSAPEEVPCTLQDLENLHHPTPSPRAQGHLHPSLGEQDFHQVCFVCLRCYLFKVRSCPSSRAKSAMMGRYSIRQGPLVPVTWLAALVASSFSPRLNPYFFIF